MANEGDRKKSSRKKNSSKRIADAVEQAKQASQPRPEAEPPKPAPEPESPIAESRASEPEPIVEVRETTTTVVEETETTRADAMPLLESEPAPPEPRFSAAMEESRTDGGTLAERASCFIDDVKRMAAEYIDASEDYARRLLDIQSEAATWAEGTALERVLKAQNSIGQRIVQSSARAARALWRVDRVQHQEEARMGQEQAA